MSPCYSVLVVVSVFTPAITNTLQLWKKPTMKTTSYLDCVGSAGLAMDSVIRMIANDQAVVSELHHLEHPTQ